MTNIAGALATAAELLNAALKLQQEISRVNAIIQQAQKEERDLTGAEILDIQDRRRRAIAAWENAG